MPNTSGGKINLNLNVLGKHSPVYQRSYSLQFPNPDQISCFTSFAQCLKILDNVTPVLDELQHSFESWRSMTPSIGFEVIQLPISLVSLLTFIIANVEIIMVMVIMMMMIQQLSVFYLLHVTGEDTQTQRGYNTCLELQRLEPQVCGISKFMLLTTAQYGCHKTVMIS